MCLLEVTVETPFSILTTTLLTLSYTCSFLQLSTELTKVTSDRQICQDNCETRPFSYGSFFVTTWVWSIHVVLQIMVQKKLERAHSHSLSIDRVREPFCHCVKNSLHVKPFIWRWVSAPGSFSCKSNSISYERNCSRNRFETLGSILPRFFPDLQQSNRGGNPKDWAQVSKWRTNWRSGSSEEETWRRR